MNSVSLIMFWLAVYFFTIVPFYTSRRKKIYLQTRRKKRGKKTMPEQLIKEFIGKTVIITCMNSLGGEVGELVATEGSWIKFKQKKNLRLINADMIVDIRLQNKKE